MVVQELAVVWTLDVERVEVLVVEVVVVLVAQYLAEVAVGPGAPVEGWGRMIDRVKFLR